MEYLYTGRINLSSFENLLGEFEINVPHIHYICNSRLKYLFLADLLRLADEFCEKNLQTDCIRKIKKTINVSNVMRLFKIINEMTVEHYKKVTVFFIVDYFLRQKYCKIHNGIDVLIQWDLFSILLSNLIIGCKNVSLHYMFLNSLICIAEQGFSCTFRPNFCLVPAPHFRHLSCARVGEVRSKNQAENRLKCAIKSQL